MREKIARQFTMIIILEPLPVLVDRFATAHHTMFIGLGMKLNQPELSCGLSKGSQRVVSRFDDAIAMLFQKALDFFGLKKIKLTCAHFTLLVLLEELFIGR